MLSGCASSTPPLLHNRRILCCSRSDHRRVWCFSHIIPRRDHRNSNRRTYPAALDDIGFASYVLSVHGRWHQLFRNDSTPVEGPARQRRSTESNDPNLLEKMASCY